MDIVDIVFGNQQKSLWDEQKDSVIEYVKTQKDSFTLETCGLGIDEVSKKLEDKSYLEDFKITYDSNGLKILYFKEDIWNDIKPYIPKTITSLTVPAAVLSDDYEFLASFPNLKTININNYNLNVETFKFLKDNTSIDTINTKFMYIDKDSYLLNDCTVVDGKHCYIRGNINVNCSYLNEFIDGLTILLNNIDIKKIEDIINNENISDYKRIVIKDCNNSSYSINIEKKSAEIKDNNFNNIVKIVNYLNNSDIEVQKYEINLEDLIYSDLDFTLLDELANNNNITIKYASVSKASYEDFKALVETIKWYRTMITDYDLSPVEKLMFAYDIMKTYRYRENEEDKSMARYPDKIIKSGYIVCVGYANFLKEILKEIDPGLAIECSGVSAYIKKTDSFEGHERNVVRIDDDKYNIHGIYVIDATWDSDADSEKTKQVLGESYTALDLYNYFLIPYEDYQKTFDKDTMPTLFKFAHQKTSGEELTEDELKTTDWPIKSTLKELFSREISDEDLLKYLCVKRPNLDSFLKMLYKVRLAEGYSEEQIYDELKRVEQINSNAINIYQNAGSNIEFFTR